METKQCKQCGELKPTEQFRKYYGGRKGSYTICKLCEKINSREKYLHNKEFAGSITDDEREELQKIYDLWEAQTKIGLKPPRFSEGKKTPLVEDLDSMLDRYKNKADKVAKVSMDATPQPALLEWLTAELTEEPEYYQDEVYFKLKEKYRPIICIGADSMLPIYDNTYKAILDQISARFDAYEDGYYDKE